MDLRYLGSADVFNNLDPVLSIPGKLQGVVSRITAPALAETLKDMARNSHQRMDLFQRQPRPLDREARLAQLDTMVFKLLPGAPTKAPFSFPTPIGNIEGPAEILSPLLQRLAAGPASFAELAQLPALAGQPGLLFQSLQLLMFREIVHPVKPAPTPGNLPARKLAQWLERHDVALHLVDECGTALGGRA
ncbi:methyltransferase regulatory domain-containing protein [Luteimonas sp. BDR2-5]|uniref:methyltransferase regulatory domain-containing protein n=1 Tax=Proluteimonas luteida TaxID=2878685 RepID=UPI0031C39F50|nr:methyltransferase regulatory domain-containing protein [Luteimonas sp. BDR2-5]